MEDPFAFQSENLAHSGVTRGCSDEAEYCTYNDRRIHNGFTRSSIQRPYTSSFRNLFNSPVRHRNQFFHGSTRDPKLVTGVSGYVHSASSQKQDGGIIAIFDGSADKKDDDGSCSFKPPEQPEAIRTQKKLCNAVKKLSGVRNVGTR